MKHKDCLIGQAIKENDQRIAWAEGNEMRVMFDDRHQKMVELIDLEKSGRIKQNKINSRINGLQETDFRMKET